MKLSIIILNYKTPDLTLECIKAIDSLYKNYLKDSVFEIIVVDNGSGDDSLNKLSALKSSIQNFHLIKSEKNLGFGKGCNLGAKHASGEYLLFLNSDTKIMDQGLIKMTQFLDSNPSVGILGGKLINPDGSFQGSAGDDYSLLNVALWLLGFERLGFMRRNFEKAQKVSWVSGACIMVRKEVFEKIGGFEKELFMYMEDVDICFRAEKQGFSTYYFPDIKLIHKERGSSNRTFAILNIYKGLLFFFRERKPSWQYFIVKILLKAKALVLDFVGIIFGNRYLRDTYSQALKI